MKVFEKKWLFLFLMIGSNYAWSQDNPGELLTENDAFENAFYDAMLQKNIQNYDKAIVSLEKCITLKPSEGYLYFEMAKNYFAQKNHSRAIDMLEIATRLDPKNKWFWVTYYDVVFQIKDFEKGEFVLKKLIAFDEMFKDDLITLYMNQQKFDKALLIINEMIAKYGKSDLRNAYKMQILSKELPTSDFSKMETELEKDPTNEALYKDLIIMYSQQNQIQKLTDLLNKLQKNLPNSAWAQLTVFRKAIVVNDYPKVFKSLSIILPSSNIEEVIKKKIITETIVNFKQFPSQLNAIESQISEMPLPSIGKYLSEFAVFLYENERFDTSQKLLEQFFLQENQPEMSFLFVYLKSLEKVSKWDIIEKNAQTYTELYPNEPMFYYYAGLASARKGNNKNARLMLEVGLDFVLDNINLEFAYYKELIKVYEALGDLNKKQQFEKKLSESLKKIK